MKISLKVSEIDPNIRSINLLQCEPEFTTNPRKIYDHQFIYVHKGKGELHINEKKYKAIPGDIFFYEPGITHNIIADKDDPFLLTGIQFDFTKNKEEITNPIGSYQLKEFKEERITEEVTFEKFSGFPPHFSLPEEISTRKILLKMINEFNKEKIYYKQYINSLFNSWLILVVRHLSTKDNSKKNKLIDNIMDYLQENYQKQISNQDIAQKFNYHPNYINKLFLDYTGLALREYIINLRIKKSIELLNHSHKTISEIGKEVGFENCYYFSRIFKEKVGFSPSKIKKS